MILCGEFSKLGLRKRDQCQLLQITSVELPLGLSSASDGNWTGFKWDQITTSHLQNAAGSAQFAFQVFRVELTIIDRFTWLRWTSGEPTRNCRWSAKRILGVPGSAVGKRLVHLAKKWVFIAQIIQLADRLQIAPGRCQDQIQPQ